mmetsp:Transcript_55948/g.120022  ORF Transcript_55948/g.120022 Transcript_55948/m.120022 type:complete len:265 (+) Transcript_55948:425-1219(+)
MCVALAELVSNFFDLGIIQEGRLAFFRPRSVWAAKRAVSGYDDIVFPAMVDQRLLIQIRVALHLQHSRLNPRKAHHLVHLLTVKVGQTNRLHQPLVYKLFQLPPGLLERHDVVLHGAILILRHILLLLIQLEAHWPVDEVQVQVFQLQCLEGLHQRGPHILCVVAGVPQLTGHKNFLPRHACGHGRLQPFTDLIFIAVHKSSVNVPVPHLDGMLHRGLDLTRLGLPRAQAQQRHLRPGVQRGAHGGSHDSEVPTCCSARPIEVT